MTAPVRIPADVDMPDRILGPLTARQVSLLATAATVLYLLWAATRTVLPLPAFLVVAVPFGVCAAVVSVGRRDGIPMDQFVLAAVRHRIEPRHRVTAPEGVRAAPSWLTATASYGDFARPEYADPAAMELPARAVTDAGVIDLGTDGLAMVAVASTVNFALRTPVEQEALVAVFAGYLHSLTAPVQVLVRTERLDLSAQIADLRERAAGLPHPALETAAAEHADYLAELGHQSELLRRQVLLVLREPANPTPTDGLDTPGPLGVLTSLVGRRRGRSAQPVDAAARRAAETRLVRRLGEAAELLQAAGIVVRPLDASRATALLAAACNPGSPLAPVVGLAGADDVITIADHDPHDQFDGDGEYGHVRDTRWSQ